MRETTKTVTCWLRELEVGDPTAATRLWDRYFDQLVALASQRLGGAPQRDFDAEDVALSVFATFDKLAKAGRSKEIAGREELWRLLGSLTAQKVVDRIRAATAQKRGAGHVRGESVFSGAASAEGTAGFDLFFSSDPTPQTLAEFDEEFRKRLEQLPDDEFRSIALRRMQGYSNDEIAKELGLATRTIERKLNLIRDYWASKLAEVEAMMPSRKTVE